MGLTVGSRRGVHDESRCKGLRSSDGSPGAAQVSGGSAGRRRSLRGSRTGEGALGLVALNPKPTTPRRTGALNRSNAEEA